MDKNDEFFRYARQAKRASEFKEDESVKDVICPIDGRPCEKDCPDRYIDQPGGGCALTTAQELGAKFIDFGGGDIGMLFISKQ